MSLVVFILVSLWFCMHMYIYYVYILCIYIMCLYSLIMVMAIQQLLSHSTSLKSVSLRTITRLSLLGGFETRWCWPPAELMTILQFYRRQSCFCFVLFFVFSCGTSLTRPRHFQSSPAFPVTLRLKIVTMWSLYPGSEFWNLKSNDATCPLMNSLYNCHFYKLHFPNF